MTQIFDQDYYVEVTSEKEYLEALHKVFMIPGTFYFKNVETTHLQDALSSYEYSCAITGIVVKANGEVLIDHDRDMSRGLSEARLVGEISLQRIETHTILGVTVPADDLVKFLAQYQ